MLRVITFRNVILATAIPAFLSCVLRWYCKPCQSLYKTCCFPSRCTKQPPPNHTIPPQHALLKPGMLLKLSFRDKLLSCSQVILHLTTLRASGPDTSTVIFVVFVMFRGMPATCHPHVLSCVSHGVVSSLDRCTQRAAPQTVSQSTLHEITPFLISTGVVLLCPKL